MVARVTTPTPDRLRVELQQAWADSRFPPMPFPDSVYELVVAALATRPEPGELDAARIVIHRVVRTMDATSIRGLHDQQEAMEQLMKFADTYPLPESLEKLL